MMKKAELQALAEKVNDYWIGRHPAVGDCAWERGTYMLGNIAAYELTGGSPIWTMPCCGRMPTAGGFMMTRIIIPPMRTTKSADRAICGSWSWRRAGGRMRIC